MVWLLALTFILRFPLLFQSLWLDESIEALALMGRMGPLVKYALADFQPPVYHFILWGWTRLAGFSEVALRFPSLLAGLGVTFFTVKLAELLKNKRTGLLAGLLVATNPLLIYYSAEGRTYMMTAFFVTASFYYLMKMLNSVRASRGSSLFYWLVTTLALWSSYLAWIVIGLQFLYLVQKKRWDIARLTFLTFLTLLLWLPSLMRSLNLGLSTATNSPEWARVVGGLSIKAVALTWVKLALGRISFVSKYLYAAVVVLLLALHSMIIKGVRTRQHPLLLIWLFGSVALAALVALFVPVYSYFRLLFIVPSYLLLLSLTRYSRLLYLVVALQLVFVGIYYLSPRFHHEDWRTLTNYLHEQSGIVAMPSLAQSAPLQYYNLALTLVEVKKVVPMGESTVFYIKYAEDLFDVSQTGQANLTESGYTRVDSMTYPGIQLDIYTKNLIPND